MIAIQMISAFEAFLGDPGGVLPPDARNPAPEPYDPASEALPDCAFLDEAALPDDPEAACIIGIIDDAIPFAHERFRTADGHSRVAAFWAQDAAFRAGVQPGADLSSGVEWRGSGIDGLLARMTSGDLPGEDALYRAAGVLDLARPSRPSAAYEAGHGAAVATMAAGFAPDDPAGRNHPLIAVSLPPKVTEDSMGTSSPPYMMAGIVFIIQRARRLSRFIETRRGLAPGSLRIPVVINISYGLTAGPRDGSTLFERFMDAVSATPAPGLGPVHFVLPMGNHRQAMLSGELAPGEGLDWRVPPDDQTPNAIELWGPMLPARPKTPFQLRLTVPGQPEAATRFTGEGQFSRLRDASGVEIARAYYTLHRYPGWGPQVTGWREGITLIALPTCPDRPGALYAPPGDWHVAVDADAPKGVYEISVQRDETIRGFHREARQSLLIDPAYAVLDDRGLVRRDDPVPATARVHRRGTISAYCGGSAVIRAGAAEAAEAMAGDDPFAPGPPQRWPSIYSGLLKDGFGGDIQAVADRSRLTAGVLTGGRDSGATRVFAGSSLAAPQVTRWLAGQLAAGARPTNRAAIVAMAQSQQTLQPPPAGPPVLDFRPNLPEV